MLYRTVESSNLMSVAYDVDSRTLGIKFKGNTEYHYYNVPESVYRGLMRAPSHGSYHAAYIKNVYDYRRIR
ncbi:MAG TPA: KTSC domain-containing protein [Bacilli bacterium]|nr:KTSC domain-containing protein [Bacilli bacterium]